MRIIYNNDMEKDDEIVDSRYQDHKNCKLKVTVQLVRRCQKELILN